jgi:sugar lactone lactonase YvrE
MSLPPFAGCREHQGYRGTVSTEIQDRPRRTYVDGLAFPEGPRWHDGRLWLSDIARRLVLAVDPSGRVEEVCRVDGHPSGLGWLPDGRLLVVSMQARQVLRLDPDGLAVHADLGAFVRTDLNDMVVDGDGWAYVTHFGYDITEEPVPTGILVVGPDGTATMQGDGLYRPNGCGITLAGDLVVAETRIHQVSALAVGADHSLSGRRVLGTLPENTWADGLCVDAEGGAWVGDPHGRHCFRLSASGQVTTVIDTAPWRAVACALGGPQRTTLFITLTAELGAFRDDPQDLSAHVDAVEVDVPGAGWP